MALAISNIFISRRFQHTRNRNACVCFLGGALKIFFVSRLDFWLSGYVFLEYNPYFWVFNFTMNMTELNERFEELKNAIAADNIPRAIVRVMDFITEFSLNKEEKIDESINFKAQYTSIERKVRNNLISNEESDRNFSILRSNLLKFINSVYNESINVLNYQKNIDFTAPSLLEEKKISICRVENLSFKYKKNNFSINNINLELLAGEITGVVGENGNGKTTLFDVISGIALHQSGKLSFPYFKSIGINTWADIKNRMAYVKQDLEKIEGNLFEQIQLESALHGIQDHRNINQTKYIVNRLGLENFAQHKWDEISGGYKLRFYLAKSLSWKPNLLILDEPLANLDIETQKQFLTDIKDFCKNNEFPMSIIISSQHLIEIEKVADKILFLRNGECIYYGETYKIGERRAYNIFEFDINISAKTATNILSKYKISEIDENIFGLTIYCDTTVSAASIIITMIENNVKINGFRDISNSSKSIFARNYNQ